MHLMRKLKTRFEDTKRVCTFETSASTASQSEIESGDGHDASVDGRVASLGSGGSKRVWRSWQDRYKAGDSMMLLVPLVLPGIPKPPFKKFQKEFKHLS